MAAILDVQISHCSKFNRGITQRMVSKGKKYLNVQKARQDNVLLICLYFTCADTVSDTGVGVPGVAGCCDNVEVELHDIPELAGSFGVSCC